MKDETYNILVVDDNLKNIQVLVNLLPTNYNVEFATNGNEAILWNEKEDFDIILLDIMMPEMNGYEVCRKIKENERSAEIPVIFLTAKNDIESITNGFDVGGVDYISKPFNTEELLARVKTHLELKSSRDKLKDINHWLEKEVAARTNELLMAKKELEKLDMAKTEFLRMISHELRTPLNGIIGSSDLINTVDDLKTNKELFTIMNSSVKRLERFSLQALDITELKTKGAAMFNNNRIDLFFILKECISELQEEINKKNILINLVSNQEHCFIIIDHRFNKKCMLNVLTNAIMFSPNNEEVTIEISESDRIVTCKISDRGNGFPKEIIDKPFEPFMLGYQHVNKNIGLSLHLSKLIMDTQGNKISIGNNDNKGAYVMLEFYK
jgi:two-component system sensor histidine kinase/response regulator